MIIVIIRVVNKIHPKSIPLYPQSGVSVEVPEADGEVRGEVLGGEELRVQEVFPIPVHLIPVICRLAASDKYFRKKLSFESFRRITSKNTKYVKNERSLKIKSFKHKF